VVAQPTQKAASTRQHISFSFIISVTSKLPYNSLEKCYLGFVRSGKKNANLFQGHWWACCL